MPDVKLAVIYARVSTNAQERDGTSLTTQVEACRLWCVQNGYTVVQAVQEQGSGASLAREGLDTVRDMVERREVQAVVTYALDRLSRETGDTLLLLREFKSRKAELVVVSAPIEDTPSGKLLLTMVAAIAEYERAMILERTRRGKERTIRGGKVIGTHFTPYGYRYLADQKMYEVDEEKAQWVRRMFEWTALENLTLYAVAERLNTAGVPTPQGARYWFASSVGRILDNEVYIGLWSWNKRRIGPSVLKIGGKSKAPRPRNEWISVPVPPLVSEELFNKSKATRQRNAEFKSRNKRYFYMLSGLLFCKFCGSKMHGHANQHYRYYDCSRNARIPKSVGHLRCDMRPIRAYVLDEAVWLEVERQTGELSLASSFLVQPGDNPKAPDIRLLEEEVAKTLRGESKKDNRASQLDKDIARLIRETDTLLDLHASQNVDPEIFTRRMKDLTAQLKAARIQKATIEKETQGTEVADKQMAHLLSDLDTLAKNIEKGLSFEEKRAFLLRHTIRTTTDGDTATVEGLPQSPVTVPVEKPQRRWRNQWGASGMVG